jgi:hypothetical protein
MKGKKKLRKISVILYKEILDRVQGRSRRGFTAAILEGRKLSEAKVANKKLLVLRGKMKMSINLKQLRED